MNEFEPRAIDERWFASLRDLAIEPLALLKIDNLSEERAAFLRGEKNNPDFHYTGFDTVYLQGRSQRLRALKNQILQEETDEALSALYVWKVNVAIAEAEMLLAAANGDMDRFSRYGRFIYGEPSSDIFIYTVLGAREQADAWQQSGNPDLQEAARKLLELLPRFEASRWVTGNVPTREAAQRVQEEVVSELKDVIQVSGLTGDEKVLRADQIKTVFENVLSQLGAEGWTVVVEEGRVAMAVQQTSRKVVIPAGRELPLARVQELIVHELLTHVRRSLQGQKSGLLLLSLGLDRYGAAEEGAATTREAAFKGEATDFAGFDGYLAIGLALGLDQQDVPEKGGRDFRKVFEIIETYYLCKALAGGKELESARADAQRQAFERCVRTFRGTDCNTPGVAYLSDLKYREGSIATWHLLQNSPEMQWVLRLYKFDPTSERHWAALIQLGVLSE